MCQTALPEVQLTPHANLPKIQYMSIETIIPADIFAELQEAADKALKGIRDPEQMRKACEDMDRISEEIRRRHGILDIGVPAIRELRDS